MVSISKLTLSVRLCDYADSRKPLHTVLPCAKNKGVAYCSKDFLSKTMCRLTRARQTCWHSRSDDCAMPCRRKGSASWAVTVYLQCLSFQLFRAFPRSAGQGKEGI